MTGVRPIIEAAVADAMAEHPKYFTPKGHEHARTVLVRKIMAAFRGDGAKSDESDALVTSTTLTQPMSVDASSVEARAYTALRSLAGAAPPFRMGGGALISLPPEANNVRVFALADLPPRERWEFLTDTKQIGAWNEFFRAMLPEGTPRRTITETRRTLNGILMPWPWPPGRDGKIYSTESSDEEVGDVA